MKVQQIRNEQIRNEQIRNEQPSYKLRTTALATPCTVSSLMG